MKVIYNKTQGAYTRIDGALKYHVELKQGEYIISVQYPEKTTASIAFFLSKDKAQKCLYDIIHFLLTTEKLLLTIEDEN